jgi:arylsulfatase A-like enzyme
VKRWLKRAGLALALPLLLAVGAILYVALKLAFYQQVDDKVHLAAKSVYLQEIVNTAPQRPRTGRPNVLILFYDDLGFGDLGFTGSKAIKTPNIDALAQDGVQLNNFHAAAPVCSPSRAAMLTGRLPPHAGLPSVVFPSDSISRLITVLPGHNIRIPSDEITIADVLKADGYRTGMIGKWHIGDRAPSLPNNMGFESFYGAHYSNDMEPFALWRNQEVEVKAPTDQRNLDALYTGEAVRFIKESAKSDKPFFLYYAHNFPHEPLHAPGHMIGKSAGGLYGDVVEGLDRGVREIVTALKESGEFENTIIVLTSDNGPWFEGSPGSSRGRKGQAFEGGVKVPFFIHWPKGLSGGRALGSIAMGTDLFPTLLDWLAIPQPKDRAIDGKSLAPLLKGQAKTTHDIVYFYVGNSLMAVSDGRFKYHVRQPMIYVVGNQIFAPATQKGPWLFDLDVDSNESYDVSMKYPEQAKRLKAALDKRIREDAKNLRAWH